MTEKSLRQETLLNVLRSKQISRQGELISAMQKRGLAVTQSCISRDFSELGIIKIKGRYLPPDVFQQNMMSADLRHEELSDLEARLPNLTPDKQSSSYILSIDLAGENLMVVKTKAGAASLVAAAIDKKRLQGVIGTVAGDDTVFIALNGKEAKDRAKSFLKQFS